MKLSRSIDDKSIFILHHSTRVFIEVNSFSSFSEKVFLARATMELEREKLKQDDLF
jgi:hypothetical protein